MNFLLLIFFFKARMLEETVGNKLNEMCTDTKGYKMSESYILRGVDAGGGEKWRRRRTLKLGGYS